jgi:hypothetical protein
MTVAMLFFMTVLMTSSFSMSSSKASLNCVTEGFREGS